MRWAHADAQPGRHIESDRRRFVWWPAHICLVAWFTKYRLQCLLLFSAIVLEPRPGHTPCARRLRYRLVVSSAFKRQLSWPLGCGGSRRCRRGCSRCRRSDSRCSWCCRFRRRRRSWRLHHGRWCKRCCLHRRCRRSRRSRSSRPRRRSRKGPIELSIFVQCGLGLREGGLRSTHSRTNWVESEGT